MLLTLGTVARTDAYPPAVIVVLLPGTSLRGWQTADAPNLHRLMQTGALAVMNTRTARQTSDHTRESPESALLTLGAGARAGQRGQSVGYDLHWGNLADTLAAHGIVIKAGGGPAAATVVADGVGRVSQTSTLAVKPGVCVIWDAGPDIRAADAVLGEAASLAARQSGRLIVLSPYADDVSYVAGHRLTPVLEWGPSIHPGLLHSPSTRRAGLVTNTDFAPSVADAFGIGRAQMAALPFGYAWQTVPATSASPQVAHLESQAVRQMAGMRLLPYLAVVLAVWIIGCTVRSYCGRASVLSPLVPMAALTAAVVSVSITSFAAAFGVLLIAAWLTGQRLGLPKTVVALAALHVLALTVDMLTGSRWMHQSLLGYSAIEGARYYGIGNEAMGVLVGAALVTAARLWPDSRAGRWATACALAGLSLLLGTAGAKAGGLLVSLTAFGTFLYSVRGGRWSRRTVLVLGGVVVGLMAMLALADAFFLPQSSSHIGEAVHRIARGGIGEAWDIVQRKFAVEGRLAYHSTWALLLGSGLGSLWTLWKLGDEHTDQAARALRQAGLVGLGACLALNDAGVVAAALSIIVLWCDTAANTKIAPASAKAEAGAATKRFLSNYRSDY